MLRQSPSRNQKSKGFKVKRVLHICLLLAVCIWLLYQVKHSLDKKKAFDDTAKISEKIESGDEIIKFGRKDLHPRVEETESENERHMEEEENEEEESKHVNEEEESKLEDEEEIKHEEEEEESNPEEGEDEGRGGGDDEIDEQEIERDEEEAEKEEGFVHEENESIEESEEKERGEKERQTDHLNSSEDQGHDRNMQEAREENYKGDDASSAVLRDIQEVSFDDETTRGGFGNLNEEEQVENTKNIELELLNKTNSIEDVISNQNDSYHKVEAKEIDEGKSLVNVRTDQLEVKDNSTAENAETSSSSLQNETKIILESALDHTEEIATSNGGDSNLRPVLLEQTNSNTTAGAENADAAKGESKDLSINSETIVPEEQLVKYDATAGAEDGSASSTKNKNADVSQSLSVDTINSSIPQEEKEIHTNLETFPEIETKGTDSKDAIAE